MGKIVKLNVPVVEFELIELSLKGDLFSMGKILGKYGNTAEYYIRQCYYSLSREEVMDCKQEICIFLLLAIRKFTPDR